jgi:16S rRNA (uracil1498-N3)-methyltransferase
LTSDHFIVKKSELDLPSLCLRGKEHHHLSRVVRIRPGESVWLIDEEGTKYFARVESVGKEETRLRILENKPPQEAGFQLTLAQAVLKAKKMDLLLQKSTELGVRTFIPLTSSRSIIRLKEKSDEKTARWQRIVREAAKQSRSSLIPHVLPPQSLERLVEERKESIKLYLSEDRGEALRNIVSGGVENLGSGSHPSVLIAVGPEGGWTEAEQKLMLEHGYAAVSLGNRVLRAETAALCAAAVIFHFWNY